MGRGKLALELISKEKSRRLTFQKRKKGLIKKAKEFSILCGVDTCMVIYGTPTITERPEEPEIWPPNPQEVGRIIHRYRGEGIDRRSKRAIGLPEFFINRKKKLDSELDKARSAFWEAKYPVSDDLIAGLSKDQLGSLISVLGHRLDSAKKRLASLKLENDQYLAAGNNINLADMVRPMAAGFDFGSLGQQNVTHSYYVHGITATGLAELEPAGPPQYIPAAPPLPLELTGHAGLISSSSIDHHKYYPLMPLHYQMENLGAAHHHSHLQQHEYPVVGGFLTDRHEKAEAIYGESSGGQSSTIMNGGGWSHHDSINTTSSSVVLSPYNYYNDVAAMKHLIPTAGRAHQYQHLPQQYRMADFKAVADSSPLVHHQINHDAPLFNQFHIDASRPQE